MRERGREREREVEVLTLKDLASRTLTSAGIRSPNLISTRSPTVSSSTLTVHRYAVRGEKRERVRER